jgi:enoyl-CoA hydratase
VAADDLYGFTYVKTEMREAGVLWVTLDRPERRNAITREMHDELTPLFRRIGEDRSVRVVVLTGAGEKAFCVGADFGGMQENLDEHGYDDGFPELMSGSAGLVRAQLGVPQPMISAVNGDAIGLGATLALFCDIALLADHARIGDPHVNAGLVAGDGGAILWPMLMGLNRGKELLLTGDLVDAVEAHRLGPREPRVSRRGARGGRGGARRAARPGPAGCHPLQQAVGERRAARSSRPSDRRVAGHGGNHVHDRRPS